MACRRRSTTSGGLTKQNGPLQNLGAGRRSSLTNKFSKQSEGADPPRQFFSLADVAAGCHVQQQLAGVFGNRQRADEFTQRLARNALAARQFLELFVRVGDAIAALAGKLSHDDLSTYNQVQKLLYGGIIVVGILIVLSGLSIWKPVQFQYLTALFGGYDVARYVHFTCMALIVGFLVVHVALAILVPKSLRAMIIGR